MVATFVLLSTSSNRAEEPKPLLFVFDQEPTPLIKSRIPGTDEWGYYITAPDNIGESLKGKKHLDKHITVAPDEDKMACRIQSKRNYVGVGRLIDKEYTDAQFLSWKWRIIKHPHNGTIGGTPNDSAMTIHVCFRASKVDDPDPGELKDYEYTILGFTWTHKTKVDHQKIRGRSPWRGMPKGDIFYQAIRDGVIEGELTEKIDLKAEYKKGFSKEAPPLWAIVIMCDSNDVEPEVGEMTTDAVIRELTLSKSNQD